MRINFAKLHGLGNDYIYINNLQGEFEGVDLPLLSQKISDRHFGVGSDGLIIAQPSDKADFRMQIFNADGSEAEMCGNGMRAFAKYLYDRKIAQKKEMIIETLAGIIKPRVVEERQGKARLITVDMGEPVLETLKIPANWPGKDKIINEDYDFAVGRFNISTVSMGNPHCVIFVDSITDDLVLKKGPVIHQDQLFPRKTNVEFIKILSENEMDMRVWERGSGETLACGTGACASTVAAVLTGRTQRSVKINLLGGSLQIEWNQENNRIYKTGPAEEVFQGYFVFDQA
ncbi:MAG: diaminopimelate epimerase [Spirochaetales bacterium]|nr:diaminopimelate epimerase [Spirochaetales bacterium]